MLFVIYTFEYFQRDIKIFMKNVSIFFYILKLFVWHEAFIVKYLYFKINVKVFLFSSSEVLIKNRKQCRATGIHQAQKWSTLLNTSHTAITLQSSTTWFQNNLLKTFCIWIKLYVMGDWNNMLKCIFEFYYYLLNKRTAARISL